MFWTPPSRSRRPDERPLIYLTPRGRPLTQERVRSLAAGPGVILLCGRFEGVDQRVIEARAAEEISIGDYVLSGGEPAALVLMDACIRLLPGVMGDAEARRRKAFAAGLLEYPHYTRPRRVGGPARCRRRWSPATTRLSPPGARGGRGRAIGANLPPAGPRMTN